MARFAGGIGNGQSKSGKEDKTINSLEGGREVRPFKISVPVYGHIGREIAENVLLGDDRAE